MKSLLQTKEWADLRQGSGWQAYDIDGISVLQRKLFLGKTFLYAPEIDWREIKNLPIFLQKIQKIAKENQAIFFRLEILDEIDPKIIGILKQNRFIKSFEELQPEHRQIIDISKPEEEILAQMKEKGRYNIRVAERHNVVIEKMVGSSTSLGIKKFYQLFAQTAKRDGFEIRPQKYFEKLMEILGPNYAELLLAKYQGKTLAAEIVTYYNETASYLYGASSNEDRNLMAPYLLHWQAIKNARQKGCKYYDLLAVAPEGVERHKYAGISRFKRQFGGRTVQIVGGYDLIYQPFWYKMFKVAEKIRRK